MEQLYFLDQAHHDLTQRFLNRFQYDSLMDDRQYGAFCYLAGATGKKEFLKFCSPDGIIVKKILECDTPFSSTEWHFTLLALHLFNDRHGQELTIEKLFGNLGARYRKTVYVALEIRYGFDRMLLPNWVE